MPEALMAGILGCTSERGEPFAYWLAPLERFRIVGHTEVTLRAARDDRHHSDNVRVARQPSNEAGECSASRYWRQLFRLATWAPTISSTKGAIHKRIDDIGVGKTALP